MGEMRQEAGPVDPHPQRTPGAQAQGWMPRLTLEQTIVINGAAWMASIRSDGHDNLAAVSHEVKAHLAAARTATADPGLVAICAAAQALCQHAGTHLFLGAQLAAREALAPFFFRRMAAAQEAMRPVSAAPEG